MPVPEITIFYAGILGLMAIALGAGPGSYRGKVGVDFGDGGDQTLAMMMRRHANFVENAPLAIILIALLEMQAVSMIAIHALGLAVVIGRGLHAYAFSQGVKSPMRGIGAGLTALAIVVASIWGIVTFLMSFF